MSRKLQEYEAAAEAGTRPTGLRLLSYKILHNKNGFSASVNIGNHETQEDAEQFIQTLSCLMHNQSERTTDYAMWSFSAVRGNQFQSAFSVGPTSYFERYGELGGNPNPHFQLPSSLGFEHVGENVFSFSGQETDGRQLLLRLGLSEVFLDD